MSSYTAPAGASDGAATYTKSFTYFSARTNVQGRGFETFGQVHTTDSRNSLIENIYSKTAFPYTGQVYEDDLYQSNGTTHISTSVSSLTATTLDGTANNQRYFPYTSDSNVQSYELGGSKNGQLITTNHTTFTFDNNGNATNVVTTLTDNDTGSPYYNGQWTTTTASSFSADTGPNWCLNQPTSTTVTKTAPSMPAITRTTGFSLEYTKCHKTAQTVEPASGTYAVTTTYGFDSFGNINSIAVAGAGLSARTTGISWGTTGQFPMSITNPLSEPTGFGYDANQGTLTSLTDPNGVVTSWQYDNFGRKTRETRPDGTYTAWVYSDCAVAGGCIVGSHALTVTRTVYNANATVQTDGTSYFDQFDRPLIDSKRTLASGAYDRNEVRYDGLGHMTKRYMPCTWSSVATACPYATILTYDALDRLTQTSRPQSASIPSAQLTTIQYMGRTTITTDPQSNQTTRIATVAGRLGRTQDNNGYYQNLGYDSFGSLVSVTDSLANSLFSASYAYGIKPFQIASSDMDLGSRSNTYDALGELTAYSDANGHTVSVTYDALSRPRVRTEHDLTTTWTWGSATNHDSGLLEAVAAGLYSESYGYDGEGRVG